MGRGSRTDLVSPTVACEENSPQEIEAREVHGNKEAAATFNIHFVSVFKTLKHLNNRLSMIQSEGEV